MDSESRLGSQKSSFQSSKAPILVPYSRFPCIYGSFGWKSLGRSARDIVIGHVRGQEVLEVLTRGSEMWLRLRCLVQDLLILPVVRNVHLLVPLVA